MSERHPDDVRLAEWAEGLLSPGETASVRAHLGECARCRAVEEDLILLRDELAHLDDDLRMPDDVATGLDRALSSLSLTPVVGPAASPEAPEDGAPGGKNRESAGATASGDTSVSRETTMTPRVPPGSPRSGATPSAVDIGAAEAPKSVGAAAVSYT
ncbi:anti-sigma factor family protein, partial [Streptomyces alkaliphilus]|uniref:anti-sigma factor family protein n=1 Tax=Streptomyces alkaliphilus TaxID=1472722 RepID=UPI001192D4F0